MRGVDHYRIDARVDEGCDAIERIRRRPDSRADAQTTAAVFTSTRTLGGLLDIFDGDETLKLAARADDEHFLDAVLVKELQHLFFWRIFGNGDESLFGRHHRRDGVIELGFETKVAARDDADHLVALHDRHAGNAAGLGKLEHLTDGGFGRDRDGIEHHAALEFLDSGHLERLRLDGHALVNDADTALLGDSDREARLGHRIHRCRDQREVQANVTRQSSRQIDFARENFRISRDQKHVIESECFLKNTHAGSRPMSYWTTHSTHPGRPGKLAPFRGPFS